MTFERAENKLTVLATEPRPRLPYPTAHPYHKKRCRAWPELAYRKQYPSYRPRGQCRSSGDDAPGACRKESGHTGRGLFGCWRRVRPPVRSRPGRSPSLRPASSARKPWPAHAQQQSRATSTPDETVAREEAVNKRAVSRGESERAQGAIKGRPCGLPPCYASAAPGAAVALAARVRSGTSQFRAALYTRCVLRTTRVRGGRALGAGAFDVETFGRGIAERDDDTDCPPSNDNFNAQRSLTGNTSFQKFGST